MTQEKLHFFQTLQASKWKNDVLNCPLAKEAPKDLIEDFQIDFLYEVAEGEAAEWLNQQNGSYYFAKDD